MLGMGLKADKLCRACLVLSLCRLVVGSVEERYTDRAGSCALHGFGGLALGRATTGCASGRGRKIVVR